MGVYFTTCLTLGLVEKNTEREQRKNAQEKDKQTDRHSGIEKNIISTQSKSSLVESNQFNYTYSY